MNVVPHSRAIEYRIELDAEEAVALYWAFDAILSKLDIPVRRRAEWPNLQIVFEIYDGLYKAGISP